ncbi:hypothetical protein DQP57_00395 [Mycobacterium colombiense]|uniref:Uncharacterized protein n=2 Tax=Mycobacterium colombiense TaxID=339268 RepID=A0A329MCU6_9MYCO|nr:hypothetical protein DQP57_00395 [Mycobacterium colombiense]
MAPILTKGTVTTLAAGQQATFDLVQTSPGGAGVASEYTVNLGLPQGADGTSGTTTIGTASDVSGTPAAGDFISVSGVNGGTPSFEYVSFPWGNVYNATSFDTVSESGNTQGTLGTINIPAQTADYYPIVYATAIVNGTANTVVELLALINSPTTGQVVAQVPGLSGTANQRLVMIPGFGALIGASGYGKVSAGETVEIYLVARQTASVSDSWAIEASTVTFTVETRPVAS